MDLMNQRGNGANEFYRNISNMHGTLICDSISVLLYKRKSHHNMQREVKQEIRFCEMFHDIIFYGIGEERYIQETSFAVIFFFNVIRFSKILRKQNRIKKIIFFCLVSL